MLCQIETSQIVPGNNDRTVFDARKLNELAQNIREHGLIQPITVRQVEGTELFQIVAGERRFRACADILKWDEIHAIVADLTDEEAAAIMLSENVSRADIDPVDEANAYAVRMRLYGWSVSDCARHGGVSDVRVQFRLKLLKLRTDILAIVRTGDLSIGYAQILADAGLDINRQMIALAHLRDNPKSNPQWFRKICNALLGQQAQPELIDNLPILTGLPINAPATRLIVEPPTPATHLPKTEGDTPQKRIESQISFWESAAEQWSNLGKPFKRQECQAAAKALQFALIAL